MCSLGGSAATLRSSAAKWRFATVPTPNCLGSVAGFEELHNGKALDGFDQAQFGAFWMVPGPTMWTSGMVKKVTS